MSASIRAPTRITTSHATVSLLSLITDFDEKRMIIPPHQREYCWPVLKQQQFILSILLGYPVPSILLSKSRTDNTTTLEDGRQRLETASRFRQGKFKVGTRNSGGTAEGRSYSELTAEERIYFDTYQIPTVTYMNATTEDRIQIFDWAQNGAPLMTGERYHAHSHTPLIRFVKILMMTPGSGLHDRAAKIWGVRGDSPDVAGSKDKRRNWLRSAVALALGLIYGPANITKRYENVIKKSFLTKEIPTTIQAGVKKDLERILEIYEAVDNACGPSGKTVQNQNFDIGNFTGYMLYSLSHADRVDHADTQVGIAADAKIGFDDGTTESPYKPNSLALKDANEWLTTKNTWVNYLTKVRTDTRGLKTKLLYGGKDTQGRITFRALHANLGSNGSTWHLARWQNGYTYLFNPTAPLVAPSAAEDESDESETSDE